MAVATPNRREYRRLNPRSDPLAPWWHVDIVVVVAAMAIAALGIAVIYSATRGADPESFDTFFLQRQTLFVVLGVGLMVGAAAFDYRHLRPLAPVVYGGSVLLLLAVLSPLGVERNQAQSWFEFGSLQLQPAEFAKLGLIVGLAAFLSRYGGRLTFGQTLGALGLAGVPLVLILGQPDVGTVLVMSSIAAGMLIVAGIRIRDLLLLATTGALGVASLLGSSLLAEYQRDRLLVFIDPDGASEAARYNLEQAQIAIGNGGLWGQGYGQGSQTRGGLVPEQQTDFIFTVVGEELGFVGAAVLLGLFAVLLWRLYRTARIAGDLFGSLLAIGVFTMVLFQLFQAAGMTMGIMPVTGIPLPLVSYGGSSALTTLVSIGIVVSVHMRRYGVAAMR